MAWCSHLRRSSSRVLCRLLLCVVLVVVCHGAKRANAHRFDVNNTLASSVAAECFDPKSQPRRSNVTIVRPGMELSSVIVDFSMSRVCAFSWLGTAKVKQFVVWERNACDTCSWAVDSSGFSRRQYDGSFKQLYLWQTSCYSS